MDCTRQLRLSTKRSTTLEDVRNRHAGAIAHAASSLRLGANGVKRANTAISAPRPARISKLTEEALSREKEGGDALLEAAPMRLSTCLMLSLALPNSCDSAWEDRTCDSLPASLESLAGSTMEAAAHLQIAVHSVGQTLGPQDDRVPDFGVTACRADRDRRSHSTGQQQRAGGPATTWGGRS